MYGGWWREEPQTGEGCFQFGFLKGRELLRCSHGAELNTVLQTALSLSRDEPLILKSEDHREGLGVQWNAQSSGKKPFFFLGREKGLVEEPPL